MIARLLSLTTPVVIAHRGGSALRPENTIAAFDHAVALGADAVECYVHLSSDGVPVVIHDATLDRTTNARGPVRARTADELAALDAGCRFGADSGGPYCGRAGGVPRLATLLGAHPTTPVVIEIKGDSLDLVARVLDVVRAARAENRVIIGGFSHNVLRAVRVRAADVATSASSVEVRSAMRRAYVRWAPRRTGFRAFQIPLRLRGRTVLSRTFVTVASRAGIPVHAWVIDDATEMRRLCEWGVTGIITDRPDTAIEVLAGLRAQP